MYRFSCVVLALCVSFVPHLFHASNLPRTLLRVSSHSFVLLCSVSSVSTSTAASRLCAVRARCVVSCCILSMSGVSFRCSQTECDSSRQTCSSLEANFVSILCGVPFLTMSFAWVAVMEPMRIAILAGTLSLSPMHLWNESGVSGSGASNMLCV